jgi:glycosyltransferase involved in cell wall biosynthesis
MRRAALLIHGPLTVTGGVERYNRYLLNFLKEEGFEVDVYDPSVVDAPSYARRFLYPFVQYYYVGKEVNRNIGDYDLVLTNGHTAGFLKGRNVANISFGSAQSYGNSIKHAYNRKFLLNMYVTSLFDRLSKKGKLCIAISPQVEAELRNDYGVQSVMVPCGIDTKHFSRHEAGRELKLRYGVDPHTVVGVFAGRWDIAHKGLDILIPIIRDRTDVHWLIAPDCDVDLKDMRNLTVLRNVGYEELPTVYSAADFSIQLSRYESFGFSFVESLSCSVPVISTPVGIATEVYADPILNPLLVSDARYERDKLVSEVHKIIDSLKDRHYRNKLAARVRELVQRDFSLESWKERMRSALRSVCEGSLCR